MSNEDFVTLNGYDWAGYAQPDGPNTEPIYLSCHDFGDFSESFGDFTLKFRPDPNAPGRTLKTGTFRGAPGLAELTLTPAIRKTRDVLSEYIKCPAPIYLQDICGRRDIFEDWDSQNIVLDFAGPTERTISNVGKKSLDDNEESMIEYSFQAPNLYYFYKPSVSRLVGITEVAGLNAIDVCSTERCTSNCGEGIEVCQNVIVAGDVTASSPTDTPLVWESDDSGSNFTASAASPFSAGDDVAALICIPLGNDTYRWIAFNGTTDAGAPAQIAYSDDGGATWTTVSVGSTNGQYFLSGKAVVYTPEGNSIWAVTTGGYVYKSTDKGLTWTAVHAGSLTTQNFHSISRFGKNLLVVSGATDAMIKSTDGGASWTALTVTGGGNTLNRIFAVTKFRYFVGDSAGNLYFTEDGGTTWTLRNAYGGSIADISFIGELFGFMLQNTASPVGTVYYTRNGGYTWEPLTTPTNEGLNMIHQCSPNEALVVGEPITGGNSVVLKVAPDPAIG